MKCTSCGNELLNNAKFCTVCGAPVPVAPKPETPPAPPVPPVPPVNPVTPPVRPAEPVFSPKYKPLSPWAYFGLQLLFSLPLVGFICLIVFSLDDGNIHRRNFARSYWCSLLLSVVLIIALIVLFVATGVGAEIISELEHAL